MILFERKMKKIISMMTIMLLSFSLSTQIFAMDKRVTSSSSKVTTADITKKEAKENSKYWRAGYLKGKATGHVTAKQYHYANVTLYTNKTNHIKESGRKWGKGKISVDTGWDKKMSCLINMYFSHIYYGFDK